MTLHGLGLFAAAMRASSFSMKCFTQVLTATAGGAVIVMGPSALDVTT